MHYSILFSSQKKLGNKEAETLVEFVDSRINEANENNLKILATKEDFANVREELANVKSEIIKWMFIFWIGQIGVLIAILTIFFK
ncbi:MAG: hypothetical protein K8S16_14530 [Bacteroidales bacterium]|nr:hypothetical protein [Bacteroidales bacterium]